MKSLDAKPPTIENAPPLYQISVEEFKESPKELKSYQPGEKVTRENFINFLILSFGISRGQPKIQILFLRWLELKVGFDYSATLVNFRSAGGYLILSDVEKSKFVDQFKKVSRHNTIEEDRFWISVQDEIEKLSKFTDEIEEFHHHKMNNINSFSDFLELANKTLQKLRFQKM